MIQVHVFRKGQEVRDVPAADLSEVRGEPRTLVWVDLVSPTPGELAAMGEEFQLPWPAAPPASSSGPGSRSSRGRCR